MLSLLRAPKSRVVYVTSQPIHERVLDYYFSLVPELDTPEARSRFAAVSLVDGRNEPLSRKLLARPGALERIRRLIGEPEVAMIVPFCMTADEVGLAEALQLPDLRLRPGARLARLEDRESARLLGGGCAAPRRARRPGNRRSAERSRRDSTRVAPRLAPPS